MIRLMIHKGSEDELQQAAVVKAALMWSLAYALVRRVEDTLREEEPVFFSSAVVQLQETSGVLYYNRETLRKMLSPEDYERLADLAGFAFMDVAVQEFEKSGSMEDAARAFMKTVQEAYERGKVMGDTRMEG